MTSAQKHSDMVRERDDRGQYVETVGLDDVVAVFDQVRGPVITSSDVSEALECTNEAARQKLGKLYDRGEVDKRKTGRTTVWWHTGGERITPDDTVDTDTDTTDETTAGVLGGWSYGRSEEEREASRQIAQQAVAWLRETDHDRVTKSDVPLDEFARDDPLSRTPDTLWTQVVRDAWQYLAERGHVTQPTARSYCYEGETPDNDNGGFDVYDPTEEFE